MVNYVDKFYIGDEEILIKDTEARNMAYNSYANTVESVYLGDYSSKMQPGSVVKVQDMLYCFDGNNYDSYGDIRTFNLSTNQLVNKTSKKVGHANSVCFNRNDNSFYLAPMYEYVNGSSSAINKLYKYANDFNLFEEITTPVHIKGVSFDYVTGKMYCASFSNQTILTLYEYSNGEFTPVIENLNIRPFSLTQEITTQDIAVKNGILYVSSINRHIVIIDISSKKLLTTLSISSQDRGKMFNLGELEGYEFDENGLLIGINAFYYHRGANIEYGYYSGASSAVVTYIPTGNDVYYNTNPYKYRNETTFYLNSQYDNIFRLDRTQLHNINQVLARNEIMTIIECNGNIEMYNPIFNFNTTLKINNNAVVNLVGCIETRSSLFSLYVNNGGTLNLNILNYSYPIYANIAISYILFVNRGTINNYDPDINMIGGGYYRALVNVGSLGNLSTIKVHSTDMTANKLSVGGTILNP